MSFTDARHEYRNVIDHINEATHKEESEYEDRNESYKKQTLALLKSIADAVNAIKTDYRLVNIKDGQTYGNRFSITLANGIIQLDLKRPALSSNLPTGLVLNLPMRPLTGITLINEGAGNLYFDCVKRQGDLRCNTYLAAGATITIDFKEPTLERVNIRCDANLTLNMIAIL